jgi:glutathione peroxidase-family protein
VKLLFGAKFPLFEKCDVNGENTNEVFRFLRKNTPSMNKKDNTR